MGLFGAAMGGMMMIDFDADAAAGDTAPDTAPDEGARDTGGLDQLLGSADVLGESRFDEITDTQIEVAETPADGPSDQPTAELADAPDPDPAPTPDAPFDPIDYVDHGADFDDLRDGPNLVLGTGGDDTLKGYMGDDTLIGAAGDDILTAGDGNDVLLGDAGDDTLEGGFGDDLLVGGDGEDLLQGGWGDDVLHGRDDDESFDYLNGGEGDDVLIGGRGDNLNGGGGADLFAIEVSFDGTIDDFEADDRLEVTYDGGAPPELETDVTDDGLTLYADGARVAFFRGMTELDLTRIDLRAA